MNDNNIIETTEKTVDLETFLRTSNIKENSGIITKIGKNEIKSIYLSHDCFGSIPLKIIKRYSNFDKVIKNSMDGHTDYFSFMNEQKKNLDTLINIPLKYFPIEVKLYFQYIILADTYTNLTMNGDYKYNDKKITYQKIITDLYPKLCTVETYHEFIIESITYIHSCEDYGKPPKSIFKNYTDIVENLYNYLTMSPLFETYKNAFLSYLHLNFGFSTEQLFYSINKILKSRTMKSSSYFINTYVNNSKSERNFWYYLEYIKYQPSTNMISSFIRAPKSTEYKNNKILFKDEEGTLLELTKKEVSQLRTFLKGTYIIKT